MNLEITDKNLYLLLPGKISRLAKLYIGEYNISLIDAIRKIYHSDVYKSLANEKTKLWHYGPVVLYNDFLHELKHKK